MQTSKTNAIFYVNRYTVQDDHSLFIKKLSLDGSAMFQCLASHEAGEKSSYVWLRVKSQLNCFYSTFPYCIRFDVMPISSRPSRFDSVARSLSSLLRTPSESVTRKRKMNHIIWALNAILFSFMLCCD